MKKSISGIIFYLALILMHSASAQTGNESSPVTRSRNSSELNKESSSWVADPDPLDPLPVKSENLKEDEEPVLEDIRQVIDAPPKKKKEAAQVEEPAPPPPEIQPETNNVNAEATQNPPAEAPQAAPSQAEVTSPPVQDAAPKRKNKKKKRTARKERPSPVVETPTQPAVEAPPPPAPVVRKPERQDDEPDLNIENRFHRTFKKYNAEPTDESGWQKVVLGVGARAYTVQPGDTLWSISGTLFGDSNFWPKLWAENRRGIENPHFLTPGMQVVFAAGTIEDAPALALQPQQVETVATSKDKKAVPTNPDLTDSTLDEGTMSELPLTSRAGQIPDSLPYYKNPYLTGRRDDVKIELEPPPAIDDVVVNDIFISDSEIESEAIIPREEDVKGRCGGSQIIYTEKLKADTGTLKILEPLEKIKTEAGRIYTYRIVGEAQVLPGKKVKVTSCRSVSPGTLTFVSASHLPTLRTNKVSQQQSPIIIGGPNAGNQLLFTDHQIAYVDVGPQPVEMGQVLKVRSKLTEEVSGEIKVIDKFGSFAIGVVTDVVDLIETGDSVLIQ